MVRTCDPLVLQIVNTFWREGLTFHHIIHIGVGALARRTIIHPAPPSTLPVRVNSSKEGLQLKDTSKYSRDVSLQGR